MEKTRLCRTATMKEFPSQGIRMGKMERMELDPEIEKKKLLGGESKINKKIRFGEMEPLPLSSSGRIKF